METLGNWLAGGRRIFVLALPLAAIQMTLKPTFPGPQNLVSDWARLLFMLVVFVYGAMFYGSHQMHAALRRNFTAALTAGLAILVFFVGLHFCGYRFTPGYNAPFLLQLGILSIATLCWLIVWLGLFERIANSPNRLLTYANEAVLPFYILHQTVIIVLGYAIVQTDAALMTKYLSINVAALCLTLAMVEGVVKRLAVLRVLFGMRRKGEMGGPAVAG